MSSLITLKLFTSVPPMTSTLPYGSHIEFTTFFFKIFFCPLDSLYQACLVYAVVSLFVDVFQYPQTPGFSNKHSLGAASLLMFYCLFSATTITMIILKSISDWKEDQTDDYCSTGDYSWAPGLHMLLSTTISNWAYHRQLKHMSKMEVIVFPTKVFCPSWE